VICVDGHTYERHAIERWLQRPRGLDDDGVDLPATSPLTGLPLRSLKLVPNRVLKNCIDSFFSACAKPSTTHQHIQRLMDRLREARESEARLDHRNHVLSCDNRWLLDRHAAAKCILREVMKSYEADSMVDVATGLSSLADLFGREEASPARTIGSPTPTNAPSTQFDVRQPQFEQQESEYDALVRNFVTSERIPDHVLYPAGSINDDVVMEAEDTRRKAAEIDDEMEQQIEEALTKQDWEETETLWRINEHEKEKEGTCYDMEVDRYIEENEMENLERVVEEFYQEKEGVDWMEREEAEIWRKIEEYQEQEALDYYASLPLDYSGNVG